MTASKGSTDLTPGTFTTSGEAGIAPVTTALQKVWTRLAKRHGLPEVTIVVKRDGRAWGHTTLNKVWGAQAVKGRGKAKTATLKSERLEVMISGENLSRGAVDVLGTLLHEAVHVANIQDEIQDCDVNGRHTKGKFAARAEAEFGLEIKDLGNYLGWTDTYVPEATQAVYATEIRMIKAALAKSTVAHHGPIKGGATIVVPPAPGKTKTGGRAKNLSRAICDCAPDASGWRPSLRASAKVLSIGIRCEACETNFRVTGE